MCKYLYNVMNYLFYFVIILIESSDYMVSTDLKLIKKHYGEKMMHLCRELFPTILERNGLLFKLLS